MLGSGTEAVMAALRLARAYTGRKWVIKIGGAYHGWSDQMVYGMRLPGTGRREALGIPKTSNAYIQERFPNDLEALRRTPRLNRLRGGTAAIIVEPLGPESGTRPVTRDFNRHLETLCREFGALLIFDEVVTGFRVGMGGAQGYFGVKPDITVLGKCLTGGYPMGGGIGGRREIDFGNVYGTRRQRWINTGLYDLPFGHGRKFASNANRFENALIGGWQVSRIFLLQTGPYLTAFIPGQSADPSGTGSGVQYGRDQHPDRVGKVVPANRNANQWLNPNAFACPSNSGYTSTSFAGNACGVGVTSSPPPWPGSGTNRQNRAIGSRSSANSRRSPSAHG